MTGSCTVVLCTVPPESAREVVDALLDERLIACANMVGPVVSRYRWQGAVVESEETLLVLKTSSARTTALRERLAALHPYEVPEILELPAAGGHPAYLDWVAAMCSSGEP